MEQFESHWILECLKYFHSVYATLRTNGRLYAFYYFHICLEDDEPPAFAYYTKP